MALFSLLKPEQIRLGSMTVVGNTGSDGAASDVGIKDQDDMSSNSATHLATQQSIKAYVDSQDLDFSGTSGGAQSVAHTQSLTFAGGSGVTAVGSAQTITINADHDGLTNFVADEHIAHSGVDITAGAGLTGGGNIAATRTLNVVGGTGITANADDVAVTAAQTGITSVYNAALQVGYAADGANLNFASDNQIDFEINGEAQIKLMNQALLPSADNDVDLGSDALRWKNIYVEGNLDVLGNLTTNQVEVISTSTGVLFEGGADDDHEATLKSAVANGDVSYTLPNATGFVPLYAVDPGTTTISSTPAELNLLDGSGAGNIVDSKAVIYSAAGKVNSTSLDVVAAADVGTILTLSANAGTNKAITFTNNSSVSMKSNHATALTFEDDDNTAMLTFDTTTNQELVITNKPLSVNGGLRSLGLNDRRWGTYNVHATPTQQQMLTAAAADVVKGDGYEVKEGTLDDAAGGDAVFECEFYPIGANNSLKGAIDLVFLNGLCQIVEYLDGEFNFTGPSGQDLGAGLAENGQGEAATAADQAKIDMLRENRIDCLVIKDKLDDEIYLAFADGSIENGDIMRVVSAG